MSEDSQTAEAPRFAATTWALVARLLGAYVRPHPGRIVAALICMAVVALSTAGFTQLIKPIIDDIFVGREAAMLWPVALAALAVSTQTAASWAKLWSRVVSAPVKGACVFLVLCLLQPPAAGAHDDPSGRITELTYQIALDPNNAALLLKRGELLSLDGHFEAALKDFELAARHDGGLREVDYQRGLTLLRLHRAAEAKPHLDRYIAAQPDHSKALSARARTLVALGDNLGAARDFTRAIDLSPLPDYYLERARALAAAGHVAAAVKGLDRGLKRLGALVSLQRLAIDLDLARNNIEGAVARVDSMAAVTGRADIWLARRGDILLRAGRRDDARAAYGQALAAIETLSRRRQRSKTVRDLKNRLEAALGQLAATDSSTPLRRGEAPAAQFQ